MENMVIGRIDIHAYPEYNDSDYYIIEGDDAIVDFMFLVEAYETILMGLAGEYQAEAFLKFTEENNHGTFIGDGYTVEF